MKVFQKKPDVKETVRNSNRDIGRGVRDIEREMMGLKREEAKLIREIKAEAAKGNNPAARQLAKSLVRLRGQQAKMLAAKGSLQGVKSQMTTAAATARVGSSMATATAAMQAVGIATNPQKVAKTMQDFSRENAKMDMASEMIDDTLDDALAGDEEEEETNDVVNQVLDEIGVDMSAQLGAAPRSKVAQRQQQQASTSKEDQEADELVKRLAALR